MLRYQKSPKVLVMLLEDLLNTHGRLDWRQQDPATVATRLCFDSRLVEPGSVYVAIRGHSQDGHQFLAKAIEAGAVALVIEDISQIPASYKGAVLEVLDTRLSLQSLSQRFYQSPGEQLLGVAVTGTNGKSSITYIVEYLLNQIGKSCGVIGTIDHHLGKKSWKTSLTTPDPVTLQKRLKDFLDLGARSFVIEASSHALSQNRLDQGFDVAIFTNLSRDHLDYHSDMEDYFLAKAKLFTAKMLKENADSIAVINGDDPYGQRLANMSEGRHVYTYGKGENCDLRFTILKSDLDFTEFNLTIGADKNFLVKSPMIGEYNVYNLVAGLATLYGLGFDVMKASESFQNFPGVPGRMQKLKSSSGVYGLVDYAHTPDALEKAILAIKPLLGSQNKLITVFGCGGDRDKGKRPLMGEIASRLSDLTIVTSDNPRTEDPGQIIQEICSGIKNKKVMPFILREEAIEAACQQAQPGDAILVAGKGHEDYQIVGTTKNHFDDLEVLGKYLP